MLVLSRRPTEKIVFPGTGITVQVLSARGNVVKIGIEAPQDVQVLRAELIADGAGQPHQSPGASASDRLQRASQLLQQLIGQHAQGLGGAAIAEILSEMKDVLAVKDASAAPRPTRLGRGGTANVTDLLAERAGFKAIMKREK